METPQQESFLKETFQACRSAFRYVGLFSFFVNVFMLTVPIYMLQLFDRVLASHSFETLFYLTIIAITALLAMSLVDIARNRILIRVSSWLDNYLSPAALARSADEILQGRQYGSQSLRDIASVRQFLCGASVFSFFDSPWVPVYLTVIFLMHPVLGMIATIGAIILFSIAVLNELITRVPLAQANTLALSTQSQIDASMRNAEVIQAMGMMPGVIKHWAEKNQYVLMLQALASRRASTLLAASKFCRLVLQLSMLGVGAYYVVQNEITAGVMIAASILMSRALAPVEQAIGSWKQMTAARQAYKRLQGHFAQQSSRTAGIALPKPKGFLQLENVHYAPPGTLKPTINNISYQITAGETIAIVGPSAAGKSTLARLIVGAWKASYGNVRLDGANVYTWDRKDFGKYVGYLPQDVELFAGTVKDNVARLGQVDDEAVIAAAKLAGVHEMILKLPQGYSTEIGSGLFELSGGQRQRVALARALYQDPQVLVLDEPNSNLDNDGEQALVHALTEVQKRNATIIIIAHRPAIINIVDKIVVMNEGKIQFAGDRDQVLKKLQDLTQQSQKPNKVISHSANGGNHGSKA